LTDKDRGYRLRRHETNHEHIISSDNSLNIIWFEFFPMNEMILKRKLPLQQNRLAGWVFQHFTNRENLTI
jgi:hypothetical protein